MRRITLGVAVTLDGFIEGPNGEYDWCFTDQDYGITEFSKQVDALVMGRKTFDTMKGYEGPSPWSHAKTYVFSRTLKAAPGVEVLSGNVLESMNHLRQQPGKDIWLFGGADLAAQFSNHNLIDEYWLSVHPILLGTGKPLFKNLADRKKLKLVESKTYATGLVSLRYQPDLAGLQTW
ncbi:MAG: dihydrofolate reductase [Cyclobacteriaceae bacterium]|nr:dihydrofolate reductase [Cytophagales bacterium]MBX2898590.1 dihydrofolate reductase [Cyclobacteriaceae bacterium]